MSAIEREFEGVFKVTQRPRETRQQFLSKVVEKVDNTTDDDWERLTSDAQRWFNSALKAWDTDETIPDFPDAKSKSNTEDASNGKPSGDDNKRGEDTVTTTKKKNQRPAVKVPVAAKKRVVASNGSTKPKQTSTNGSSKLVASGASTLKREMLKKMTITDDELKKILKAKGFPLSPVRISIIRNEFKHSMRLLTEEELLKKDYKF